MQVGSLCVTPGTLNLPFLPLIKGNGYESSENIAQALNQLRIKPSQSLVFSCGS